MESLKFITQPHLLSRIGNISKNPEKLMIIVDEQNSFILDNLIKLNKPGIQIMYIITNSFEIRMRYRNHSRIYPFQANISSILRHDIVDEILFCVSSSNEHYVNNIKHICKKFGVSLLIPSHIEFDDMMIKRSRYMGPYSFNIMETCPRKRNVFKMKNWWDISFASFSLILLIPVFVIIGLIIKLTSKGPVFFKQLRVGIRGRKFYIYKFRTMVVNAEALKINLKDFNEADGPAFKIINDPRITSFGRVLRKTGLDELPQLLNVLKGDMSVIGPRPMLPTEVSEQEEWQLKRICIKPGITCSWQIQPERNKVPFHEWMMLDKDYVDNWSVGNDIKILFNTFKSIFLARGA